MFCNKMKLVGGDWSTAGEKVKNRAVPENIGNVGMRQTISLLRLRKLSRNNTCEELASVLRRLVRPVWTPSHRVGCSPVARLSGIRWFDCDTFAPTSVGAEQLIRFGRKKTAASP